MKTITLQIGNSDDGLTQRKWSEFVRWVDSEIRARCDEVHFSGASPSDAIWQNYCWVFNMDERRPHDLEVMKKRIKIVSRNYNQESVVWTEGETEFI